MEEKRGKDEDGWGQQGGHGQEAERRETHRHSSEGQGDSSEDQAGENEARRDAGASGGRFSAQDRESVGLRPPGLRESLAGKGGASEGEGPRADLGVDSLVQGQVVSLLRVQEEEPV